MSHRTVRPPHPQSVWTLPLPSGPACTLHAHCYILTSQPWGQCLRTANLGSLWAKTVFIFFKHNKKEFSLGGISERTASCQDSLCRSRLSNPAVVSTASTHCQMWDFKSQHSPGPVWLVGNADECWGILPQFSASALHRWAGYLFEVGFPGKQTLRCLLGCSRDPA